jgi:hypothetical protein
MKKLGRICQGFFIATVLSVVLACPMWAGEMPQPVPPPPVTTQPPPDVSNPVPESPGSPETLDGATTVESLTEAVLNLLQASIALF